MRLAHKNQKFQDWFTQQWAIFWGKKIEPENYPWLMGTFGEVGIIGDLFVQKLARIESLTVERNAKTGGLISFVEDLKLKPSEYARLSKEVCDFYENTSQYSLNFQVSWNPLFKQGGNLIKKMYSLRLRQLNIPQSDLNSSEEIKSEIIHLRDPVSGVVKYTVWYRTFKSTGQVLYSGIYGTCTLPGGKICIKAVFPLPNGNATVIMEPRVSEDGALILNSSGKKFGDAGFYFLLNDAKGNFYADFKSSFRDRLEVTSNQGEIKAVQTLTLWHHRILEFKYSIQKIKIFRNI